VVEGGGAAAVIRVPTLLDNDRDARIRPGSGRPRRDHLSPMARLWMRIGRRSAARRADRLTLGLAGMALATAGTVIVGEGVRLARRRTRREPPSETMLQGAEHRLETAGRATQDAVAVLVEGYEAASRTETVLFNLLSGFVFSFALVRLSTAGIRRGWWPFRNVRVGGRHIHHFVPGILTAFGSGAAAILTDNSKLERRLAVPFGAGIGLTFDEAALLLDFRDVYWTREGILSVQVSLGLTATLAGTILALRMLRRGEERVEAAGRIPPRYAGDTR
jgi:hypothetical protein